MNIRQATSAYEEWMRTCCRIVEADIRFKHDQMRKEPFLFFRATYYRWAQLWPDLCGDLAGAPRVLAVGDLHIGSFGTWRDSEGRLCWGVDDFDEAWPLPYTNDLVRLAASAKTVAGVGQLTTKPRPACEAILEGYTKTLQSGGSPFVLAERDQYIEKLGIKAIKPAAGFWDKLDRLPVARGVLPKDAQQALSRTLPQPRPECKIVRRKAGVGSLGQERFVALAEWQGGWIARELKALLPSASVWLEGGKADVRSYYQEAIDSAIRSHDPYQTVGGHWITRRLSPDSNPIEISELPKQRDEEKLLRAMGAEAANVHLGRKRQRDAILSDLGKRKAGWLEAAARSMAKAVVAEWKEYAGA
ncbi:MAG: DUF2252 domain-containing protein [Acidobacteriota bacterium]|nr:DUF2252 domain-containing protein [Acidobacteriota bacterium]